jgi:hypothetical protein
MSFAPNGVAYGDAQFRATTAGPLAAESLIDGKRSRGREA